MTVCSDISSPPLEFYTSSNVPTGSDVDLGDAMAAKMGLTAVWANTAFNGIIPALQAKRCDVIMSQLYIKPAREKVVDFVPYMYSGSTFIVKKTGGLTLTKPSDLCRKKAAAETGTTVVGFLTTQSAACQKAGKAAIDIRQFSTDPAALQQLKIGLVDAYGTTVETAAYDIKQNAGQFVMAGKPFNRIKVGAATTKNNTALHDALTKALSAIHRDGQYQKVMTKWGLTSDILPLS
ncbi:ABC transporter substrate-binding protein [Leekyejoonella antrihumi]|uniref:ABC transporter substrate-binding protein n=1 Tax=Leekyejoonella antrihumi TaxID=1660198 RepID=UPI001C93FE89|nr:ABC transporter substrate-binding protein [Leekyejoonella antrihumi]